MMWFDAEQVEQINKGEFDVDRQFTSPEESKKVLVDKWTFNKPAGFDEYIQRIRGTIVVRN